MISTLLSVGWGPFFRTMRVWSSLLAVTLGCLLAIGPVAAQDPLYLVNEETQVSKVSFHFVEADHVFDEDDLETQIVTRGPGFWDKVKRILPFVRAREYPFDPVELARDVYRLEQFYEQNGFPDAEISYTASQFDSTDNEIHVIFSVEEGPPLIIQEIEFLAVGGDQIFYQLPSEIRNDWIEFRQTITLERGDRYSLNDQYFIEGQVVGWFRNRGYAFANVYTDVRTDERNHLVDIAFVIDPGPRGYVSEINVAGNESVSDRVILRELPFEVGDLFRQRDLAEGQRELYSLNIFRAVNVNAPLDQPRDSTVAVDVTVREAQRRYVSVQGGFGVETGVNLQAEWTNRNFLGGARSFTVGAVAQTGIGASQFGNDLLPERLYRFGFSLTQPYLFTRKLSATVSPYVQLESNPQLTAVGGALTRAPGDPLDIDTRLYGVNTTLLYEFYPYRTLSLQHTYQRALQRNRLGTLLEEDSTLDISNIRDLYNRSIITLNGILGEADNFINPQRGFLIRPFVETGGAFLGSDVEYFKVSTEATAYRPIGLGDAYNLAGRLFLGRVWPFGFSREALFGRVSEVDSLIFENRFDPILFYAGGATLRGWDPQLAGPKIPRPIIVSREEDGEIVADTTGFYYEPLGGVALAGANLELRMPFPGLGPNWRTAAFVDAAMLGERGFAFDDVNVFANVGVGVRYLTIIGYIRLDVAYKLNPSFEDLRRPEDVFRVQHGLQDEAEPRFWRRFNLQLSIGPAF